MKMKVGVCSFPSLQSYIYIYKRFCEVGEPVLVATFLMSVEETLFKSMFYNFIYVLKSLCSLSHFYCDRSTTCQSHKAIRKSILLLILQ